MLITVLVYGVVALIVKMDDIGLRLAERPSPRSQRLGELLVTGMPKLLAWLSVIGTAAMLWVGGHILLVGFDELGWEWPYHVVHDLEHAVDGVPGIGGVLAWVVNTALPRRSSASWSASSSPPWWNACPAEGPAPTGPTEPRASNHQAAA